MRLAAIMGSTLLDYPGRVACILFTQGCPYDCFYCHNRQLIPFLQPLGPEPSAIEFLERRRGLLEGVVISGGEPTAHADLPSFIRKIKDSGFLVKLDTNGNSPRMLRSLLDAGLLDYVALDVKAPWERYHEICGPSADWERVADSLGILKDAHIGWEVRTTVCPTLSEENMQAIGKQVGQVPLWRWNAYRIPSDYRTEDHERVHACAPDHLVLASWIESAGTLRPNIELS